jgi:hypothetical protein
VRAFPDAPKRSAARKFLEVREEVQVSQFAHAGSRHRPSGTWRPELRIAIVVAACLVVEAVVAKNIMDVTVNIVAFLAPLWVFAVSQAWPTKDKAFEIATMIFAIASTAGVLAFYAL